MFDSADVGGADSLLNSAKASGNDLDAAPLRGRGGAGGEEDLEQFFSEFEAIDNEKAGAGAIDNEKAGAGGIAGRSEASGVNSVGEERRVTEEVSSIDAVVAAKSVEPSTQSHR